MSEPASWTERLLRLQGRVGAGGFVAVAAFVAALAGGMVELPQTFRNVYHEVGALRTATPLERRLGGARRVDLDTRVFVEAERLIPRGATYAVVTGPHVQTANPVTLFAVAPFAGYWLLPRRRMPDPRAAEWIVSYGADLQQLGLDYVRVLDVTPGISIAEVR